MAESLFILSPDDARKIAEQYDQISKQRVDDPRFKTPRIPEQASDIYLAKLPLIDEEGDPNDLSNLTGIDALPTGDDPTPAYVECPIYSVRLQEDDTRIVTAIKDANDDPVRKKVYNYNSVEFKVTGFFITVRTKSGAYICPPTTSSPHDEETFIGSGTDINATYSAAGLISWGSEGYEHTAWPLSDNLNLVSNVPTLAETALEGRYLILLDIELVGKNSNADGHFEYNFDQFTFLQALQLVAAFQAFANGATEAWNVNFSINNGQTTDHVVYREGLAHCHFLEYPLDTPLGQVPRTHAHLHCIVKLKPGNTVGVSVWIPGTSSLTSIDVAAKLSLIYLHPPGTPNNSVDPDEPLPT
jgi:hypothetical protein